MPQMVDQVPDADAEDEDIHFDADTVQDEGPPTPDPVDDEHDVSYDPGGESAEEDMEDSSEEDDEVNDGKVKRLGVGGVVRMGGDSSEEEIL